MESSLELHPKLLWMEQQREEQEEEEAEGWQKNQGTIFNFLTCAWHSSTLLRVVPVLRTPRDKYIGALPRKRLK